MAQEPRKRQDVPVEDQWDVALMYADEAVWETDFAAAQKWPELVSAYSGRLGESADVLAKALRTWFDANRQIEKLYVYAHLRADEDLGNSHTQQLLDRIRSAYVRLSAAGAYLSPEIIGIEDATMQAWMAGEALAPYRFWLADLLRAKPHTLSSSEERLMAMVSEPLGAIQRIYSVLKNVDLAARLPKVRDEEGQETQLTHGGYIRFLESKDRAVRKGAFDAYYAEYRGNRHTNAVALDGIVKVHLFEAQARQFPSALDAALYGDNVPRAVYEALISAVHEALPAFYRYLALRKRRLGVDKLHLYDIYVPVIPDVDARYSYAQAVEMVCAGLAPLGADYGYTLRQGLDGGWVDRYENIGKRSGAYSSGCYDSLPYILLNYNGNLDAVFTLAHELGHSLHSWYSDHAQPYHLADYRLLLAEVASTTNESLLTHYLLAQAQDRNMRAYLLDRYLDSFRGTIFRQTMFAEFEKLIHEQAAAGQPLTVDGLDATYYDLVKLYFGDTVAFDQEDEPIAWEWSRIDHFFYNFYVYKYATGMSAAVAIAEGLLRDGEPALQRYLAFLKSGGSNYPLELLHGTGVDLASPRPVRDALAEFERLVGELEELI